MYTYKTPEDVRTQIGSSLDLSTDQISALADAMWRQDLDPRNAAELASGFRAIGLNPDDYGIGR